MLSLHLAELYQVEPKVLTQSVKRNIERFPQDFMFQLTWDEVSRLKSQFVISTAISRKISRSQFVTLKRGLNIKYPPYAFTEQGVAMLSSVLRSDRAAVVNIAIMRTFVRLREILATHKELAERLAAMEREYDQRFKIVFDILKQLMEPPPVPPKRRIGFVGPGRK